MAGAGTDYAVFLISRYHDYLRSGQDFDEAVTGGDDVDREGDHRVRRDGGAHLPVVELHQDGSVQDGRSRRGDRYRRRVPGRADSAAGHPGAGRAARVGEAAARTHRPVLAAFGHPHRAPAGAASRRQSSGAGLAGRRRDLRAATTTTIARSWRRRPRVRSGTPRSNVISRSVSRFPNTSSSSRRTTCGTPQWPGGPGADGLARRPVARRRSGQRHHPSPGRGARGIPGHVPGGHRRYPAGRWFHPDRSALRRSQPAGERGQHAGRQPRRRADADQPDRAQSPGSGRHVLLGAQRVRRRQTGEGRRNRGQARAEHQRALQRHGVQPVGGQEHLRLDRAGAGGAAEQRGLRQRTRPAPRPASSFSGWSTRTTPAASTRSTISPIS